MLCLLRLLVWCGQRAAHSWGARVPSCFLLASPVSHLLTSSPPHLLTSSPPHLLTSCPGPPPAGLQQHQPLQRHLQQHQPAVLGVRAAGLRRLGLHRLHWCAAAAAIRLNDHMIWRSASGHQPGPAAPCTAPADPARPPAVPCRHQLLHPCQGAGGLRLVPRVHHHRGLRAVNGAQEAGLHRQVGGRGQELACCAACAPCLVWRLSGVVAAWCSGASPACCWLWPDRA
jgi:hypothetical protein